MSCSSSSVLSRVIRMSCSSSLSLTVILRTQPTIGPRTTPRSSAGTWRTTWRAPLPSRCVVCGCGLGRVYGDTCAYMWKPLHPNHQNRLPTHHQPPTKQVGDKNQSVYIYGCGAAVIDVRGKGKSVILDNCKRTQAGLRSRLRTSRYGWHTPLKFHTLPRSLPPPRCWWTTCSRRWRW